MQTGKRGKVLVATGVVVAVFAIGLVVGLVVTSDTAGDATVRAESQEVSELREQLDALRTEFEASRSIDPQRQPWPYVELDVEEVRKIGHEAHHENSCAYGAFNAIVGTLQSEIGYPYDQVPTYMLHFGRGGVAGSGDVCGAVLGALSAINLVAGEEYRPLAAELIAYYRETPFPTDISNEYAVQQAYYTEDYISERLAPSAAGDIACDISKSEWAEVSGYDIGSAERHERCARLTGDVAAMTAVILNAWAADAGVAQPAENVEDELARIFPDAQFELLEGGVYEAREAGELVGYAGIGEADGHEGPIRMAIGAALDGTVYGVHVVEHQETPDIGDIIVEEEFLSQFEGLSIEEIQLRADGGRIDATTGATVSCEVAADIVRNQLESFSDYLE